MCARYDEQGSMVVAVLITMIVVAIVSVFAAAVIGNQFVIKARENTSSGIAAADAGVSDALFRIDQISSYPLTSNCFAVSANSSPPGCSGQAPVASNAPGLTASTAAYTAAYDPIAGTWTILSKGTTSRSSAAVQETLSRTSQFPYALFGKNSLGFNGNNANGFGTYTPGTASSSNPDTNASDPNAEVRIGSNGSITCDGGLPANLDFWIYSKGSLSCPATNYAPVTSKTLLPLLVQAPPTPNLGCPNGGKLGHNNGVDTLAPGIYYCYNTTVTIDGSMSVGAASLSNPVKLYIEFDPNNTALYQGTAFDITDTGKSNPPPPNVNYNPPALPDAEAFQIFSNSAGTFGDSNGNNTYTLGAIVDAPDASLVGDGCKSVYYGALIINTLTCNGGPHLTVYYDQQLKTMYGPWQVSGFEQIPPANVKA